MGAGEINPVRIGERLVGPGQPVYVIAEAGVNHNGAFERARVMCDVAKAAGADAVKFQAFRTADFVSAEARQAQYQRAHTRRGESQRDMLRRLELTGEQFRGLAGHCRALGIEFLATPFDLMSLSLLAGIGVRAIKISSPDLVDTPLLTAAAATRLPLILSTGAAELREVAEAVHLVHSYGCADVILLHCVSIYPTPFELQNLMAIQTLRDRFRCVVGYSDHSQELLSGRLAATLGASVLEKHFTLSRAERGPDNAMSLEPPQLAEYIRLAREMPADLVELIRGNERAQKALGHGYKLPHSLENDVREVARKSVAALVEIPAGATLTRDMLTTMRPGTGIPVRDIDQVVGMTASAKIKAGSILTMDMIERVEGSSKKG